MNKYTQTHTHTQNFTFPLLCDINFAAIKLLYMYIYIYINKYTYIYILICATSYCRVFLTLTMNKTVRSQGYYTRGLCLRFDQNILRRAQTLSSIKYNKIKKYNIIFFYKENKIVEQ